jgi:conjugative transfer signal peptidase TraF
MDQMTRLQRSLLFTTREAAERLRLNPRTLENMRGNGTGPPFRKIGGRVFYHLDDLKDWLEKMRRRSSSGEMARALWGTSLALALLFASIMTKRHPLIIWNQSLSAPIGLYWVEQEPPRIGDLVIVRLPGRTADLAALRGYLPHSAYLLKPVAGTGGDRVCRRGGNVFIGSTFVARALELDRQERPLPQWQGCRTLRPGEYFLLSRTPASFDGRYFGPIHGEYVIGCARPVLRRP